ncbi:MAG: hypothetical protein NUV63_12320, partial [Gallionella sp.]|nr:hypothetical protein [Gallionella sp.]
ITGTVANSTISGFLSIAATTGTFTNVGGTLSTAAQPNVTSLGTLSALTVTSAISVNGGLVATASTVDQWMTLTAGIGTRALYWNFNNDGGANYFGIDSSAGNQILGVGGVANALTLLGPAGLVLGTGISPTSARLTITSAGAASFGTNSLTAGAITASGAITMSTTASPTGTGAGVVGQMAWDTAYFYICTASNDWRRIALVDF